MNDQKFAVFQDIRSTVECKLIEFHRNTGQNWTSKELQEIFDMLAEDIAAPLAEEEFVKSQEAGD